MYNNYAKCVLETKHIIQIQFNTQTLLLDDL